ncbi:unnamed protein product [Bursaphelenchus xylophilus]|uniref:(pine wood nematode) hypothetical protein n=1 Tax=Bursaphelenchus xylophilus TaxID=6326 RepID=A0A1I7RNV3_BURXY|nr:unnamed protein product [Bursaphelenchus xylophilus]CAG9124320.1 unnamed protein product [Bursaphelenchus xylophilus]
MRSNKAPAYIQLSQVELTTVRLPTEENRAEEFRVPKFLVEAFDYIKRNDGFKIEGIFRRQGNNQRIDNAEVAFDGRCRIPEDCTPVDVAVLIKRFFSHLEGGIFLDKENQIIAFAMDKTGKAIRKPMGMFTLIKALPRLNVATLAYLMQRLKRVCDCSETNKMDPRNMGTCIAPSLFVNTDLQGKTGQNTDDIKFGIGAIANVLATMITRHVELAKPPMMLRGQHPPSHHSNVNRVGSSYSSRSSSCHLNSGASAVFETPNNVRYLPPSGSVVSTTSVPTERVGERDKKKQGAKKFLQRRGSSVVRTIKNLGKYLPGRRTSGVCDDPLEPMTTKLFPRKNTSTSDIVQPKNPMDRSLSFRAPSKPQSAPFLGAERARQDLQRQNSMFCIKTPEDQVNVQEKEEKQRVEEVKNIVDVQEVQTKVEESTPVIEDIKSKEEINWSSFEFKDCPTPLKPRDVPLTKTRRRTAPVGGIALKRNQPNTVTAGLKDGRKQIRRTHTLNAKRQSNENLEAGFTITKYNFNRFTRHKSKSQIVPEGSLLDNVNEGFMMNGLEPIKAVHPPAVLRERTASTVNSQDSGFTRDRRPQENPNFNNVASLIKRFDANVGVRPP